MKAPYDGVDGLLGFGLLGALDVGDLLGGVERALAVDAHVEEALDQPGDGAGEHPGVLPPGLGLLERRRRCRLHLVLAQSEEPHATLPDVVRRAVVRRTGPVTCPDSCVRHPATRPDDQQV